MSAAPTHLSPRRLRASGLLLALAMLVSACTISPAAPRAEQNSDWARQRDQLQQLESWQLGGRVNVRYDNKSYTPRIKWIQEDVEYQIELWGTFNAGHTTINGRPGYVTLENNGNTLSATTPEDIILQQLGYELPVSHLNYWIKGLPAPDSEAELSFNELNQLTAIAQAGWDIIFIDPRQYGAISLPRRVELRRAKNDIWLRFVGLNWTLEEPSTNVR